MAGRHAHDRTEYPRVVIHHHHSLLGLCQIHRHDRGEHGTTWSLIWLTSSVLAASATRRHWAPRWRSAGKSCAAAYHPPKCSALPKTAKTSGRVTSGRREQVPPYGGRAPSVQHR